MEIGSIVTLKKGVVIPMDFVFFLAAHGVTEIPTHGKEYMAEGFHTFTCESCDKEHVLIGIDGVGNPEPLFYIEWFEELLPAHAVCLEELNLAGANLVEAI